MTIPVENSNKLNLHFIRAPTAHGSWESNTYLQCSIYLSLSLHLLQLFNCTAENATNAILTLVFGFGLRHQLIAKAKLNINDVRQSERAFRFDYFECAQTYALRMTRLSVLHFAFPFEISAQSEWLTSIIRAFIAEKKLWTSWMTRSEWTISLSLLLHMKINRTMN